MSYNSNLEADIAQAIASSNEALWNQIYLLTSKDPLASQIFELSLRENWSTERYAAVLINLLLLRSEEWRQQMIDLYAMKPAAPVLLTINDLGNTPVAQAQMDALAEHHDSHRDNWIDGPDSFDRGPGC
jgi:hypothetical protein